MNALNIAYRKLDTFAEELIALELHHAYLLSAVALCAAMKPVKLRREI